MRIVVDTNVFISGVFFAGLPYQILDAWRCGMVQIVISPPILDEYRRVGAKLASDFPRIELQPGLELLAAEAVVVDMSAIPEQVCRDLDDDKFLACAIAGNTKVVISGDRDLLAVSGYTGINVLTPRAFVERYLRRKT